VKRLRWTIKTSDDLYSGTDGNVYLSLAGLGAAMTEVRIDNPNSDDNFEKGDIDSGVLVVNDDLGPLTSGHLRTDATDETPQWKVDWIKVADEATGQEWQATVDASAKEGLFPMLRFSQTAAGDGTSGKPIRVGEPLPSSKGPDQAEQSSDIQSQLADVNERLARAALIKELARKRQELMQVEEELDLQPGGKNFQTLELFGLLEQKTVSLDDVLLGSAQTGWKLAPGARLMRGASEDDGFGLGGKPGKWHLNVEVGPAVFGLDKEIGILTSDGTNVMVVTAEFLTALLGTGWRETIYNL